MIKGRVIEIEKSNETKKYQAQYWRSIKYIPFIGQWVNASSEMYDKLDAEMNMEIAIDRLKEKKAPKRVVTAKKV